LVQILIEVFFASKLAPVLEEYWTFLEREGQGGISSTTFEGFTSENERYIQCMGQFQVFERMQERNFVFTLERHWKPNKKSLRRRIASFTCCIQLDAEGHISSVEARDPSNLSVTVTRI